jgi:hypothetical protein
MEMLVRPAGPVVDSFETERELVAVLELPPGEPKVTAELKGRRLTLRVARPPAEHAESPFHPGATPS